MTSRKAPNRIDYLPEEWITKMYIEGVSAMSLAKKCDVDYSVIKRILAEHNVKIRTQSEAVKIGMSRHSRRWKLLPSIRKLINEGFSSNQIGGELLIDGDTVKRYAKYLPEIYVQKLKDNNIRRKRNHSRNPERQSITRKKLWQNPDYRKKQIQSIIKGKNHDGYESKKHHQLKLISVKYFKLETYKFEYGIQVNGNWYIVDVVGIRNGKSIAIECGHTPKEKLKELEKVFDSVIHVPYT